MMEQVPVTQPRWVCPTIGQAEQSSVPEPETTEQVPETQARWVAVEVQAEQSSVPAPFTNAQEPETQER